MYTILNDPELRKAPGGQFRVVGLNTLDQKEWVEGDFASQKEAIDHARAQSVGKKNIQMHVFNQVGDFISQTGAF